MNPKEWNIKCEKCKYCILGKPYSHSCDRRILHSDTIIKKKLVLFVVCGMASSEYGIGYTLPLMMEEDDSIEYAAIVYMYRDWMRPKGLITPINCFAENLWQKMAFVIPFLPIPSHPMNDLLGDLTEYLKAFAHINGEKYEKILLIQLNEQFGEINVDEIDNMESLILGIGLYPRKFKNYYFDLLGYDGNCGVGFTEDFDFCEELVSRSLPEIKECIKRLLNGEDIPHQTFTNEIEPYRMYEGH